MTSTDQTVHWSMSSYLNLVQTNFWNVPTEMLSQDPVQYISS